MKVGPSEQGENEVKVGPPEHEMSKKNNISH